MITQAIFIFVTAFFCNTLWVYYIKAIAADRLLQAALYSEVIVGITALATYSYVTNIYMLIPLLIGGFFGTLCSKKISNFIDRKIRK